MAGYASIEPPDRIPTFETSWGILLVRNSTVSWQLPLEATVLEWMRTRSKRDLVLAIAVTVGSVLVIGTVYGMLFSRIDHRFEHRVEHAVEHRVEHEVRHSGGTIAAFDATFDASTARGLDVSLGEVDVSVSATDAGDARVVLWVDDEGDWSDSALEEMGFRVEVVDGTLRVWNERDDRGWNDHDFEDYDMRLEVTAPRGFDIQVQTGDGDVAVDAFEGSVELRTGDGDIAVGGAMGTVRIQTGDGDVALGGASGGDVRIQTGDGDVATGRLDVGDLQVRTGDGDILIEELSGSLTATTGDGDVQVRLARFDGLRIRTGDGDVTVYAAPGLRANLELVGTEFFLDDAFALPAQLNTRSLEGLLNGGGPELSVRVGDGTIRLIER